LRRLLLVAVIALVAAGVPLPTANARADCTRTGTGSNDVLVGTRGRTCSVETAATTS
jgi:hypothetical protein